jgi:UDP-glucose 4-epimerase
VDGNDELADISLSINRMSDQLQIMMKKQEQENQRLQLQAVKMFKVLSKLAREEKKDGQEPDLSDANILKLGKKVRAEMVQRNAEVNGYRQQQRELQGHLMQMLGDIKGLTNGDLTVSTKAPDGNLADISVFFDDVICGLQNIVGEVKSSANQVNLALAENEQAIANLVVVSQRQVDMVDRSLHNAYIEGISATTLVNNSRQIMESSQLVATKLSDSDRNALFLDLQQLDKRGAEFLNLSSVAVYGSSESPRNEYSDIKPVNEYGKNKVDIEETIMNIVNPKRLLNLRIANLYGLTGFNDVTNAAIAAGHGNKSIAIPLKDSFRDYVSYQDLEQFLLDWITNNFQVCGSINFASGVSRSVSEWIEILKNFTGMDISVRRSFDEPLQYSFIDAKRLQENWRRKFLEPSDGLRRYSETSGQDHKEDKGVVVD